MKKWTVKLLVPGTNKPIKFMVPDYPGPYISYKGGVWNDVSRDANRRQSVYRRRGDLFPLFDSSD